MGYDIELIHVAFIGGSNIVVAHYLPTYDIEHERFKF